MIFDSLNTSLRDSMSGLYNEEYFAETFQREWHRVLRESDTLSIIMVHPHLDIDDPNDQASFKLISEIVESSIKRASDIACRFQSNQIAIGLFNLDPQGTEKVIKRIINSLGPQSSALFEHVNISIGAVNVLPNSQLQIAKVFQRTNTLADMAQLQGKNTYQCESF
jgi:diguanylate cyclase (GGDEF)-like protein